MDNMIPANKAIELMDALIAISTGLDMTNNGKLLIARIPDKAHRDAIPQLVDIGALRYRTFINAGDAVSR